MKKAISVNNENLVKEQFDQLMNKQPSLVQHREFDKIYTSLDTDTNHPLYKRYVIIPGIEDTRHTDTYKTFLKLALSVTGFDNVKRIEFRVCIANSRDIGAYSNPTKCTTNSSRAIAMLADGDDYLRVSAIAGHMGITPYTTYKIDSQRNIFMYNPNNIDFRVEMTGTTDVNYSRLHGRTNKLKAKEVRYLIFIDVVGDESYAFKNNHKFSLDGMINTFNKYMKKGSVSEIMKEIGVDNFDESSFKDIMETLKSKPTVSEETHEGF